MITFRRRGINPDMTTAAEIPSVGFDIRSQDQSLPITADSSPTKPARLQSLDVFRGITIAFMLLVNNPGPGVAYTPLEHAKWDGWTPTDLVFPFFLFIVGVAIPFSLSKRKSNPSISRWTLLGQIWLRALALVMLGMTLRAVGGGLGLWRPLPQGLRLLPMLHVLMYIVAWVGTFAMLINWRWKLAARWTTPLITFIFTLLMFAIYYANKNAVAHGYDIASLGRGPFRPDQFRIPGVLQRIGIVYGCAATIALFAGWRTLLISAIILMAGYSTLMLKGHYPNHVAGSLTQEDNLARHIDVAVFDRSVVDADGKTVWVQKHTYGPYPDNEGILSTIPSIATSLLGIIVGLWLMRPIPALERCAGLLAMGVPVTILGWLLNWWLMPINKNLWSPSFVVFTAGLAMLGLGFLFWTIDVRGRRRWALPFTIFGVNAIAAFCAQTLVPHVMGMFQLANPYSDDHEKISSLRFAENWAIHHVQDAANWLQVHTEVGWAGSLIHLSNAMHDPGMTSLIGSAVFILICWLLLSVLYVSKIFVKV